MPYTFASGAINAKSANLFSETEYLTLSKTDKSEYLKVLRDFGYGFDHVSYYLDEVITNEQIETKTELIGIVPNIEIIRLWYLKYDLINIKLLLKNHLFSKSNDLTFDKQAVIPIHELKEGIINNEFSKVSEQNTELLRSLREVFELKDLTSEQLSNQVDAVVYAYILKEAKKYREEALVTYLENLIDANNLITLYRAQKINFTLDNFKRHLVSGGKVDLDVFENIYNLRYDEQIEELKLHYHEEVINVIRGFNEKEDLSLLDQTLKQTLINSTNNYKYDTFSSGPLIYYLLAKEYEINNVRLLYFDKEVEVANLLKY